MDISELTGKQKVRRRPVRAAQELVSSDICCGIEIEVERGTQAWLDRSPLSNLWRITTDGSLRNNGLEFVFSQPHEGADIVDALSEFCTFAAKSKMQITARTGVHVHIDMRDVTLDQLRLFAALYSIMEKPLFNWVGDIRSKNIFCLPWHDAEATIESLSTLRNDVPLRRAITELGRMQKYSALNMLSLREHGTAEFRHLKTTYNFQRYLDWINMLMSLKLFAVGYSGSVLDLCMEPSRIGVERFMRTVFPGGLHRHLMYPRLQMELYEGIRFAQQLDASWKFVQPLHIAPKEVLTTSRNDLLSKYRKTHNL